MTEAENQHTAVAAAVLATVPPLAPNACATMLMRAADALDGALNDLPPDSAGGAFDAAMAAERAIEARILALPAGDAGCLAWKLARLAEALDAEDDTGWQATMARSCLADARALAGGV
jgi:hypothetical protein